MAKSYEEQVKEYMSPKGEEARKKHSTKVLKRKANEARTSSVLARERKEIKKANEMRSKI